ncbi:MAG: acetylglutamate kinase [Anaerolineae bacterium]
MGETVCVIKIGGAELADGPVLDRLVGLLGTLHSSSPVALVHGGGPEIASLQRRLGLEPRYVDGLRITDDKGLAVAEMVLSGAINKRLVARLVATGTPAIGLSGVDGGLFRAKPLTHGRIDLGRVGQIEHVDVSYIKLVLGQGLLPVISPISLGSDGRALNVNADHAALALARALCAQELAFVTDTPGVMQDGHVIAEIHEDLAESLILEGVITGGMVPKVRSALEALDAGVGRVRITNLDGLAAEGGTLIRANIQDQGEMA